MRTTMMMMGRTLRMVMAAVVAVGDGVVEKNDKGREVLVLFG